MGLLCCGELVIVQTRNDLLSSVIKIVQLYAVTLAAVVGFADTFLLLL